MTTADPVVLAAAPSRSWLARLSGTWQGAREFYRLLLPIRFSFVTLAVLGVALLLTAQGHDAVAALAEGNATWSARANTIVRVFFAVLVALFATQTWYWSRQLLRIQFPGQPDPLRWPRAITWLPRLLGVAAFAVAFAGLAVVRSTYGSEVQDPANALLRIMIAIAIEAALFVFVVILRRRWLETSGGHQTTNQRPDATNLDPMTRRVLMLTFLLGLVFFLASTLAVQRIGRIGTMSVLLGSLGLWVSLGGALVYFGMKARIPILTWLLIFAILISPLADNHRVRTIAGTAPLPPRATIEQTFGTWYARLAAQDQRAGARPVFIVATEGGGIRAAYWTAAVLTSLSDTVPGFTDHLFAVSGVSGGSVGAATYRTLLAEQRASGGPLRPRARNALAYDALAPTIAAFTQQDFVQRFIPSGLAGAFLPDRATALEDGWEDGWHQAVGTRRFSQGFLATAGTDADRLPSLFLNGTLEETGQRIITSNVRIDNRFAGAADFFDAAGYDVRMSTGALNSARFPYVSPLGTIVRGPDTVAGRLDCGPGDPCEHIADGGYFENSGAGTAGDILQVVRAHPAYAKGMIRPYVIFVDFRGLPQLVPPSTRANELAGPIRTLLSVRSAHASAAVAELREQTRPEDRTNFTLVQKKNEVPFPLGWLLAARTRDLMDKQMGPDSAENGANVRRVAAALGVTPLPDAVWATAMRNERINQ